LLERILNMPVEEDGFTRYSDRVSQKVALAYLKRLLLRSN